MSPILHDINVNINIQDDCNNCCPCFTPLKKEAEVDKNHESEKTENEKSKIDKVKRAACNII